MFLNILWCDRGKNLKLIIHSCFINWHLLLTHSCKIVMKRDTTYLYVLVILTCVRFFDGSSDFINNFLVPSSYNKHVIPMLNGEICFTFTVFYGSFVLLQYSRFLFIVNWFMIARIIKIIMPKIIKMALEKFWYITYFAKGFLLEQKWLKGVWLEK